ncbi:RICIN domain-containing protein [Streptomyces tubercidicus]|uniref:RICIN domain-containing protein n=1 Tax=Streptomyces tubercidicus TaxID=47759 RepID=UPI0036752897
MNIQTLRRNPWLRLITAILAVPLAAASLALAPFNTTPAQADTTSNVTATFASRDTSNGTFYLQRVDAAGNSGLYNAGNPAPPGLGGGPTSLEKFTLIPNSDGTFHLQSTVLRADNGYKEAAGPCVSASSGSLTDTLDCSTADNWNLQPASDGGNYYVLRHVGDNQCITMSNASFDTGGTVSLADCNAANTQQDWSVGITSGNTSLPSLSDSAAVDLGANVIQVCNTGGYNARADIDYTVLDASGTSQSGHSDLSSFPSSECRTATLPAGQIKATVTLHRYTGYYSGDYAFGDGQNGSFAGAGANDKITGVWVTGGAHANVTFEMQGTTCDSTSSTYQAKDSQVATSKSSDQQGCSTDSPQDYFAKAAKGTWDILTTSFLVLGGIFLF